MIELEPDSNYEWVKCSKCGHEWQEAVGGVEGMVHRDGGLSCPKCGQRLQFPEPPKEESQ